MMDRTTEQVPGAAEPNTAKSCAGWRGLRSVRLERRRVACALRRTVAAVLMSVLAASPTFAQQSDVASEAEPPSPEAPPVETLAGGRIVDTPIKSSAMAMFFNARAPQQVDAALDILRADWNQAYYAPLIEISAYLPIRPRQMIFAFLEEQTGQSFGQDISGWFRWLWNQPEVITLDYADFKSRLYQGIDPRFEVYFKDRIARSRIRLDEIRWGGVAQDGIPPLRQPEMITPDDATYLDDSNIVFGIEINGDARAYPKRILAWHEMFVDTVGGVDIAGVYCTLCGTVIPYMTNVDGTNHVLGTSGFLYRSNKLMYDAATQSLWSTMRGVPVVGPLVDQGIELPRLYVVTTSWGEWKRRHPDTTVLSLNTGHSRDYGEGVAYREYFATDDLMFNTPFQDERLANKQEVLGLRFPGAPQDQLAIDTAFLANNPVFTETVGLQEIAIFTDRTGASRVYDPQGIRFASFDGDRTVVDIDGGTWLLDEGGLTLEADGRRLPRLPAHRSFWFGWHAAFPETRLIN